MGGVELGVDLVLQKDVVVVAAEAVAAAVVRCLSGAACSVSHDD